MFYCIVQVQSVVFLWASTFPSGYQNHWSSLQEFRVLTQLQYFKFTHTGSIISELDFIGVLFWGD